MKILITGGSGSLGKKLTQQLINDKHEVVILSRNEIRNSNVKVYLWDIRNNIIDENCINGVDAVIHLAGAGIADERWSDKRKSEIIQSRTDSIKLIYNLLKNKTHQVKSIISASASGFYSDRGDEILTEESPPNNDFLALCCKNWEDAVDEGNSLGLRIVKFRTGIVLEKNHGALQKIALPIKFGVGSALGDGRQWISWIHINDVIKMYCFALYTDNMYGVFNMATNNPITNSQLTKSIANTLKKPLWLPNVPSIFLKILLGEMSIVVLGSTKMCADKILNTGFKFTFPDINAALKNIYEK